MNYSPQQKKIEQIPISTDSKGNGSEQQIVVSGRMASQWQPPAEDCVHLSEVITAHGIDDWTNNGSVLMAFGRANRIRSTRNFFLLNLILTDVLLCFTAIPITPCWSLTAIAFDKHMHIVVDPTRRRFSRRLIGFVTLAIWLMSLVVNIPYLLSFELVQGVYMASQDDAITPFCDTFCDEFNWESESRRQFYGAVVLLFQFVVPLTVITFCHLRILRKVQKDMIVQNVQFRRTLTNSQRMDAINRKRRVNYTLLGMVVAFIGCNAPLTAVNLAKDFGWEPEFLLRQPYLCPLVAHLVAMSTVCWNPILFAWLGAKDKDRGSNSNAGMLSVGPSAEIIANRTPCSLAVVVGAIRRLSRGELTAAEPNLGQQRERKNIPMVSAHFRNKLLENGKMSSKDSVDSLPVANSKMFDGYERKLKPMHAGENPSLVVPNRRRMSTNSNTF
uniref:G_PROTEIN_RECEP_F1_2 domain-containing protein n=1 Tax=Globodera pallida TaxID=36090 RepID=A0A183C1R6_GLOPA